MFKKDRLLPSFDTQPMPRRNAEPYLHWGNRRSDRTPQERTLPLDEEEPESSLFGPGTIVFMLRLQRTVFDAMVYRILIVLRHLCGTVYRLTFLIFLCLSICQTLRILSAKNPEKQCICRALWFYQPL